MLIGAEELLKKVKKEGLIKNLSERELVNPEGPGFDLRVGEVFKLKGSGFLGVSERQTPDAELVASIEAGAKKIKIKPGEYFLVRTIEEVNLRDNIFAHIYSRTTLFRSGLQLLTGKVGPGYYGKLTFGLKNLGEAHFDLELGARIAFIVFHEVLGRSNVSRGQWRGGRVVAAKKEKQI